MNLQITYGHQEQEPEADVILTFVTEQELQADAETGLALHPQLDDGLRQLYARGVYRAKPEETYVLPTLGLLPSPFVVYIGLSSEITAEKLRLAGAAAARAVQPLKAVHIRVLLPQLLVEGAEQYGTATAAQALSEGLILGTDSRQAIRREAKEGPGLGSVTIIPNDAAGAEIAAAWEEGIRRGQVYAEAVCYARELTNRPGNLLTPEQLAEEAEQLGAELDIECEVLDEWSAAEQGMGGLLGVGQGSSNPPRMIVLHYEGAPDDPTVWGWIGKGITFDTGGISLKKAAGMEEMISDMGGAAAVLGAMRIVGKLRPAVNIVAVIPAAENMPSDRALKPGDVITTMSGRTVEVVNTDAEGRLVLADGLTTAIQRGATHLVDVATLTGAVMVALGDVATGAISNNPELMGKVRDAGERSGEKVWELPSYAPYRKQLDSDAADMKNTGGRLAGTITGGLFIGTFAEERPWVHLDIGGTAWLSRSRGWESKGATGVMVRTLAELTSPSN
ncbi:leucyl aminopeptidase [Paenibacillus daejeonensis]|uniref:leucyl aminopeptidase n=1 Tax=Paenibacillus daejeonensis TaxID=135193 RepID=UPI00035F9FAE|nr:leucyl aminopeptidase [Paenibacillus daejeonensis]